VEKAEAELEESKTDLEQLKAKRAELENELEETEEQDDRHEELEEELEEITRNIREKQDEVRGQRQTVNSMKEALDESPEKEAYEEAEQQYDSFRENHQEVMENDLAKLDEDEEKELKKLFKKAAKMCHPDLAPDDRKQQATEIMQALNEARDNGDLKTIREIFAKLESGLAFTVASDQLKDKDLIRAKIAELHNVLEKIEQEIAEIEQSDSWQILATNDDLDSYFSELVDQLAQETKQLLKELNTLGSKDYSPADEIEPEDLFWNEKF